MNVLLMLLLIKRLIKSITYKELKLCLKNT